LISSYTGVGVEAVTGREVLREVAQVPLARDVGGVAAGAQQFGDGGLGFRKAAGGVGKEHIVDAAPDWVASRQQSGTAGRAKRRGGVELGETGALRRQPVQVRRANRRIAITGKVGGTEVVRVDEDYVR
jgi:hypothetical protein